MSFCIRCEGVGAGRAYLCDRCQNEENKGTHEQRIAALEKLVQGLLPKEIVYVIAESSVDYENWVERNKDSTKQYVYIHDIDKLRGLKDITVALALSEHMRKAYNFVRCEVTFGKFKWFGE